MKFQLQRLAGYILGFILFYAPFAYFQKLVYYLFYGEWREMTIHSLCLRLQIEHLADGWFMHFGAVFIVGFILLILTAVLWGPVYCGLLCPVGAITEYFSRLVSRKYQIEWNKHMDIVPLRYGMLAGFILLPFFDIALACAYCNFYVFDLIVNYIFWGYIVSLTSSLWITMFLWFVVLGIFTKGGRGFCLFLCPVGAMQNLFSVLTAKLFWIRRIRIQQKKCVGCNNCVCSCPMEAIQLQSGKAEVNLHQCISCRECIIHCPTHAIFYGKDKHEK